MYLLTYLLTYLLNTAADAIPTTIFLLLPKTLWFLPFVCQKDWSTLWIYFNKVLEMVYALDKKLFIRFWGNLYLDKDLRICFYFFTHFTVNVIAAGILLR